MKLIQDWGKKKRKSDSASEKTLIFEDNKIGENNTFPEKDFFHWMIHQTKQVETGGLNTGWYAW